MCICVVCDFTTVDDSCCMIVHCVSFSNFCNFDVFMDDACIDQRIMFNFSECSAEVQ
jgi:hypothetical protein